MRPENREYYRNFGLKMAYYRNQRNMTQKEFADKLQVEPPNISRIENGKAGLSLDRIIKISEALDVPLYLLFDFRDIL